MLDSFQQIGAGEWQLDFVEILRSTGVEMIEINSEFNKEKNVWVVTATAPETLISSTQEGESMLVAMYIATSTLASLLDEELRLWRGSND